MSEKMIAPGVFTKERDLSYLTQGIANIGAAFIGPFGMGPGFRPVVVDQTNFTDVFGPPSPESYASYAVRNYLRNGGSATVVRVMGTDGYTSADAKTWVLSLQSGSVGSGSLKIPFAVLHPTRKGVTLTTVSATPGVATADGTVTFDLTISGSSGEKIYTNLTTNPVSSSYVVNKFGKAPTGDQFDAYVYSEFKVDTAQFVSASLCRVYADTMVGKMDFAGYDNASTPVIKSNGTNPFPLFRVHGFNDGNHANEEIKISISDIDVANGTFTLSVRSFYDPSTPTEHEIDTRINQIEIFAGLTMDPTSTQFIGQQIGTSFVQVNDDGTIYIDGDYPARSKYIYIEILADPNSLPENIVPWGFDAISPPNILPSSSYTLPVPTYVTSTIANNNLQRNMYYGYQFDGTNGVTNMAYIAPLPIGAENYTWVNPPTFSLDNINSADKLLISQSTANHKQFYKFTVPFQGGFDGFSPSRLIAMGADDGTNRADQAEYGITNMMGFDFTDTTTDGNVAYKRAIDAISNPESYDINLLVLPGIVQEYAPYITDYARITCENRGDCFYIMDLTAIDTGVNAAVTLTPGFDTNYAAVYYPWIKVYEPTNNKYIWVPPSVSMPEVYAYSDQRAAEWYAPAGLNRGGVPGAVGLRTRLTAAQRDDLYEARINPIASFTNQGIVVWGQKTLQYRKSALDRVNVRRLLLTIKKFIASSARYLVFEQNVAATREKFLNIANPYLASIQERSGLYSFKIIMDASNNTSDTIDRSMLVGEIYLQPTKVSEFISLTFNIMSSGAIFPTA